jgi:hypothetical protein
MPRKETNPIVVGQRFGRFAVEATGKYCLCLCDCGTRKTVRRDHLKTGMSQSCGCLHSERSSARTENLHKANTKHGKSGTRLHSIWFGIKQRCGNPNNPAYKHYGARGIELCNRWFDFSNFLSDMGEPQKGMTLERIDNNLGYSPDNCRWATRAEQMSNTRANRRITHQGETLTITQWAKRLGVHRNTFNERLRCGWSEHDAITIPFRTRNARHLTPPC